jgi:6-O-methylguanine DNA methyltransferase, DNA binding domain
MKRIESEPYVKTLAVAKGAAFPAGTMLIASPKEVERIVSAIPKGRLLTLSALRQALAKKWSADYTCPVTTGIFLSMVAESAMSAVSTRIAVPYHRVVRDNGALLEKLPGGFEAQAKKLAKESIAIDRKWKLPRVKDLEALAWTPRVRAAVSRPRRVPT